MHSIKVHIALLSFVAFIQLNAEGQTVSNTTDTSNRRICLTHYMSKINADKFNPQPPDVFRSLEAIEEDDYFIIPVVIHVIHNNGPENINDELLRSQIDVLNEDFGHYGINNIDARGEDTRIRFCLAKRDPDGVPTTGIVRIQSTFTDLKTGDEMSTKDLSHWNPKRYLNIWVVRSIDGSSNVQGYAYMPRNSGGPLFEADGIVMTYKFFGRGGGFDLRYNLGRTCSHETGHYFDLLHTWGSDDFEAGEGDCEDDDGIYDTPNCSLDYYSDPATHCFHPWQCNNTRMVENFLDYSLDACMKLFTTDQGDKMRNTIRQYRSQLVSYENLQQCGCLDLYDSLNSNTRVDIYPVPASDYLYIETHYTKGTSTLEFHIFDMYGRYISGEVFNTVSKMTKEYAIHYLRPGIYYMTGSFAGEVFRKKFLVR